MIRSPRVRLLFLISALFAAAGVALPSLAADPAALKEIQRDQPGAADFPAAGRYDGAVLLAQTVMAFDELVLPSGPMVFEANATPRNHFKSTVTAQGRVTRSLYIAPQGRSTLEILANHQQALTAAGYKVVFQCAGDACGEDFGKNKYHPDHAEQRVVVDKISQTRRYVHEAMLEYVKDVRYALFKKTTEAGDSYVSIYIAQMTGGSRGDYSAAVTGYEGVLIEAVEPKPIEQKIVTIKADEINAKLAAEGRIAFYGIYFDFNKADLKAESDPQLKEMADWLTKHPGSKVFIVGHTDNVGGLDYNITLSLKRAQSVVAALTARFKIPAAQLIARGVGPLSPVSANHDDAGRAKNRRVEMVEQG